MEIADRLVAISSSVGGEWPVRSVLAGAVAVAAVLALATSSCSSPSGSQSPAAVQTRPTTLSRSHPVGIVAIGHSGLTGENSDPNLAGQPALENSWATGSSPEVNSVYLRLAAARPETKGHVANAAIGGSPVTSLAVQARIALASVPAPALIIIQTIDSDIQCDGTDATNVVKFGATLTSVLKSLTASSPESKILLVGQLGRPSPTFVTTLVSKHPAVKTSLTGPGICDFYDEQGRLNTDNFRTLTKIIDSYEAEQARVCSTVENCSTDGGVRAAYSDTLENFARDWNHLNVRGQAQAAKIIWPVVVSALGLNRPRSARLRPGLHR